MGYRFEQHRLRSIVHGIWTGIQLRNGIRAPFKTFLHTHLLWQVFKKRPGSCLHYSMKLRINTRINTPVIKVIAEDTDRDQRIKGLWRSLWLETNDKLQDGHPMQIPVPHFHWSYWFSKLLRTHQIISFSQFVFALKKSRYSCLVLRYQDKKNGQANNCD